MPEQPLQEPDPINPKGEDLISALQDTDAHDDLEAYVRHARQKGGTGLLSSMRTFHKGGDDDIQDWRDGDYMNRKERILWDDGAEVALEKVGNWDVTNRPILEAIVRGDDGFVDRYPDPKVHGFELRLDEDGTTKRASVSVTWWNEDHEATSDISFHVYDGVAKLSSQDSIGGMLNVHRHLVPLIAATIALEDQNLPGIDDVQTLDDVVDEAHAEARRVDLGDAGD